MRKLIFCICKYKGTDQLHSNRVVVFASNIVECLYFLDLKFQASNNLLWQCSPVCVADLVGNHSQVFS